MNKHCPVCNKGLPRAYNDQQWEFWGVEYRLVMCPECGSAYTDPMPGGETLKKVYATWFDYRWYQDFYNAKLRDCRIRLKEYQELMGRRVLDFGGGVGYFSSAAREEGYVSQTYDPYASGDVLGDEKWDTVVALHVLEHSNDPDDTVEQIKKILTPKGTLILAVPNFSSLGYRKLGMGWVWAQPPLLHIFHFTAEGLKALLGRNGFEDIKISYHERWDANLYTDLEKVKTFRRLDSLWLRQPFNRIGLYRKLVARLNSALRFNGLKKALKGYDSENNGYAELHVSARLGK